MTIAKRILQLKYEELLLTVHVQLDRRGHGHGDVVV